MLLKNKDMIFETRDAKFKDVIRKVIKTKFYSRELNCFELRHSNYF